MADVALGSSSTSQSSKAQNSLKRGEHGFCLLLSADQGPAWLHSIPLKRLGKDFKPSSFGK